MASITSNYTESRCSKDNAALLLIDHQSGTMQFNHDPTPVESRQAVIAPAKVGKIFTAKEDTEVVKSRASALPDPDSDTRASIAR